MSSASPAPSAEGALFQSLPFKTNFHGTTDIHENFTKHTTTNKTATGDAVLHNRLRGRTLVGVDVPLPAGYQIALIDFASSAPADSSVAAAGAGHQTKNLPHPPSRDGGVVCADDVVLISSSEHFILWEHDRQPDAAAAAALAQWIDLAAAIHADDSDAEA